jgi:hypothetical protein
MLVYKKRFSECKKKLKISAFEIVHVWAHIIYNGVGRWVYFTNLYKCVKMFKNAFNLINEDNKPTNILKRI